MRIGAVIAAAAVLALAHGETGAAFAAAPSIPPAHVATRGLPRVLCWATNSRVVAERRPKHCGLVSRRRSSKPVVRLSGLRWKGWTARRGRATGMAAGRTSRSRFQVTLRRPVRGCRGRLFSQAVLRTRTATRRLALRTRCSIGGGRQVQPGGSQQPGGGDQPGGGQQPVGGPCIGAAEEALAGEDGPPSLSPALYGITFTLDASLDGIDEDGTLPVDIDAVCGVPANLASDAAKLVQLSGVALLSANTEIWTCAGSAEEAGSDGAAGCGDIPARGGTLLQGDEATSTLDGADTAFVGVELVPPAGWRQDEDGEPVPTFDASWVKLTD
jgi:hypothetical protein